MHVSVSTASGVKIIPQQLFITGTDTDIGKTFVTAWLAGVFLALGKKVAVYKPVQTGVTTPEVGDACWVAKQWHYHPNLTVKTSFYFEEPAAPSVADETGAVSFYQLLADFETLKATHDVVLVEGAGGVLCPIRKYLFMADLIRHLKLPALVVTRPNLGTINHTLMSIEVLRGRGVTPCGILINEGANTLSKEEASSLAVRTVASELTKYAGTPLWPSLPHIKDYRQLCVEDTLHWYGQLAQQYTQQLQQQQLLLNNASAHSLLTVQQHHHQHSSGCGCGQ
jgi:dethiobiotin synthetase